MFNVNRLIEFYFNNFLKFHISSSIHEMFRHCVCFNSFILMWYSISQFVNQLIGLSAIISRPQFSLIVFFNEFECITGRIVCAHWRFVPDSRVCMRGCSVFLFLLSLKELQLLIHHVPGCQLIVHMMLFVPEINDFFEVFFLHLVEGRFRFISCGHTQSC